MAQKIIVQRGLERGWSLVPGDVATAFLLAPLPALCTWLRPLPVEGSGCLRKALDDLRVNHWELLVNTIEEEVLRDKQTTQLTADQDNGVGPVMYHEAGQPRGIRCFAGAQYHQCGRRGRCSDASKGRSAALQARHDTRRVRNSSLGSGCPAVGQATAQLIQNLGWTPYVDAGRETRSRICQQGTRQKGAGAEHAGLATTEAPTQIRAED